MVMRVKNYTTLTSFPDFEARFKYLALNGRVGEPTFGPRRYLNQRFYKQSPLWLSARDAVMIRDSFNGYPCDLGHPDHPIDGPVVIHHINPITFEDIVNNSPILYDLDNLICVSDLTHKAIHYGDFDLIPKDYIPRRPNDTIPWR